MFPRQVFKTPNLIKTTQRGRGIAHTFDSHEPGNSPGFTRWACNQANNMSVPNHADPESKSILPGQVPIDSIIHNVNGEHYNTIVSMERLVELVLNPILYIPFTTLAGKEMENVQNGRLKHSARV